MDKCEFLEDGWCVIDNKFNILCESCKCCYYKQLQQQKQENKKLNTYIKELQRTIINLKEYIKDDLSPTCQRLGKENEQYRFLVGGINRDRIKYLECLDEIEKICENSYTTEQQYYYRTSDTILQKIKEVKGNE